MPTKSAAPRFKPRAAFTWLHRYVGLAMAGFLIVAGITGAPLAFNAELEALLSPELFYVEPGARQQLTADELIERAERALPAVKITGLNYRPEPYVSVRAYVEPRAANAALEYSEVFIDPYDGRILGMREWGAVRLGRAYVMPFLYKLHYTLHIPGQAGVILFGIVALMWMFDCFVGFYLTLPMKAAKKAGAGKSWWERWKPAWLIKVRAGFTRVNLDIHRAAGLWFFLVAFILAMTSVSLNLGEEIARPAVAIFSPLTPDPLDALPTAAGRSGPPAMNYAQAAAAAFASQPKITSGLSISYLSYLPDKRLYWVALTHPERTSGFFRLDYAQLFLDADTGALRVWKTYAGGTGGDKFLDWQLPLHSGQILGLPGRILICLSGLVVVALSVTGVVIWWKKRQARVSARRRARDPRPAKSA